MLAPLETIKVINRPYKLAKVRPIHILDIGNLIGNNVVVGGVRRTAEIFLCDVDDWECILAKYGINGIWNQELHNQIIEGLKENNHLMSLIGSSIWKLTIPNVRPLYHRRMSNNSIAFTEKAF